jgi:hypothetical protein
VESPRISLSVTAVTTLKRRQWKRCIMSKISGAPAAGIDEKQPESV